MARRGDARDARLHTEPAASGDAKAALAQAVLAASEPVDVAQVVLRWLGQFAGVERGLCAVADLDGHWLRGLAGDGVPHARVVDFELRLDGGSTGPFGHDPRDDALAGAVWGEQPIHFRRRPGMEHEHPRTPLGDVSFFALPLTRPEAGKRAPLGMLMLAGLELPPGPEVDWAADLLATKLLCLRYQDLRLEAQRLERERSRLRHIIDAVTDPILLSDPDGRMVISNAHAEALLAAPEDVSEGRRRAISLNNMLFSASLSAAVQLESAADGAPARRELLLVDPIEGRDLLFEVLSTPVVDSRGDPGVVSVLRNVNDLRSATEQIEEQYRKLQVAEAEVRAERNRLGLIINAVVDPVLATDPRGNTVMMNPPAERLFAAGPAGSNPTRERHVRANDVVFSSFVSNLYTAQAPRWRGEITLVDPVSGRKLPFEAIAGKVITPQGEDTAAVTILHDRSEAIEKARLYEQVKQHSEELKRRVQEATAELTQQNALLRQQAIALQQASESKSRFLANISHELRTPLNAVLGYTDLLRKGVFGPLEQKQNDKLERVDANARHLLTIINDLLDIARIESGGMPVHVEGFDVADVVDEVMRQLEPIVSRSPASVTVEQVNPVPLVKNDRQKVKQIVLNLISNAIKFTPEGFVHVSAAYDEATDEVSVSVADTGVGIPEELQERIFEDFYQVDESHSRRHGGTGLGLAICRRLAVYVGGRMSLRSAPGAGSTFTLHFARRRRAT